MALTITSTLKRMLLGLALVIALLPCTAFADTNDSQSLDSASSGSSEVGISSFSTIHDQLHKAVSNQVSQVSKVLPYDRALIDQIGCQARSGHSICCPSYACAYGDAVLDGTVNDHSYYRCSNCAWYDWGGPNSAYRHVGNSQQLLREAYDQIQEGRPTVIHVAAGYGEHWITLIGYQDAYDPDDLTLANFIALDPWDGAEVIVGDRFRLYGDGVEHVSSR